MNIEEVREYCMGKPDVEELTPFDADTLVYKVRLKNGVQKMFACLSLEKPDYVSVKCDPELAEELRERYPLDVEGAYHFNKKHWNGVKLGGVLRTAQIYAMIDHSYNLVAKIKAPICDVIKQ